MKNANLVYRRCAVLVAVAFFLVSCGKGGAGAGSAGAVATPKTAADYFSIGVGEKVVRMQLAVTPGEMQRGLMDRRDLGPDDGMLFVYDKPQKMSFWMRNTPTPLDIGYFNAAGVLEEVYPMYPFDERAIESRSERIKFALETNQGWFGRNGVRPGARLDLQALAAALKERGFEPRRLGFVGP